jgi:putative adenylate-forming enzyme
MVDETNSFIRFYLSCKSRFKRMNANQLHDYQLKKGREIVKFAITKSPFFKRHYSGCDTSDIWNLPTVNKKIMMDNFTDYNTVGLNKDKLIIFLERIEREQNYNERFHGFNAAMSSGTSGSKGIVITSPSEESYLQAAFFARFSFPRTLRIKWAFLLRITTPAFQVSKFGQRLTHISLLFTLEEIRKKLQKFQPNILSAPPSMLKILAKEVKEKRLSIKPKRLVSYAEVLEPNIKEEIEGVFKTPVHQIYQGSEGSIALTCKYGSLHINEDLVFVQTFDTRGNQTIPGEPSYQMIVTDLHKKSQPIIRFELNDIITIKPNKCKCGSSFRVIDQIQGRSDDLFWAPRTDSEELQFIYPDYIRRAIIMSSNKIDEYQAIQKSFNKLLLRIQTRTKEFDKESLLENLQKNIQNVFTAYGCQVPSIDIRFEPPIRNAKSGKLIRIHREFNF